jgi:nicotinamidase-related amidase
MRTALNQLTRIPESDLAALTKYNEGEFPAPQPLEHPALLIVDMMESFVRDEYTTGWAATGEPCAAQIARLAAVARQRGVPVIYTVTEPMALGVLSGQWRRGRTEGPVPPFSLGPQAHRIVPELAPEAGDIVLTKAKPSAFYGTQLAGILAALRVRSLIVTGMTTSGCVRASAVDAFNLNYIPVLPLECVADRAQLSHEVSCFDIAAKYGDVVTLDSLLTDLAA